MQIHEEIIELDRSAPTNVFSDRSSIWKEIIARSTKQKEKGLSTSILKKSNFLQNNGCMPNFSETERQIFIDRFRGNINKDTISTLNFPSFGDPEYIDIEETKIPISHAFKLSTLFYIDETLEILGKDKRNLKCAEIGAGWGCLASLLIEQNYLTSYTDIDLPETLSIAAFYLTNNYPELSSKIQTNESKEPAFFNFSTPNNINYIDDKYDIIINEASIAEMPRETASAYLNWIEDHLNDNGILVWQNGRNRSSSPDVTIKMSDYNLARFKPIILKPQRGRGSLQNDTALFIAATLKNKESTSKLPLDFYYDVLTQLSDIGVTDDVISIYEDLPKGELSQSQLEYIFAVDKYFELGDLEEVIKFYSNNHNDKALKISTAYLIGVKQFLDGKHLDAKVKLEEFLKQGHSPVALAFSTSIFNASSWKVDGENCIPYLANKLTSDFHWPEIIKKNNLDGKALTRILNVKSKYPWVNNKSKQTNIMFKPVKKALIIFKSLLSNLLKNNRK